MILTFVRYVTNIWSDCFVKQLLVFPALGGVNQFFSLYFSFLQPVTLITWLLCLRSTLNGSALWLGDIIGHLGTQSRLYLQTYCTGPMGTTAIPHPPYLIPSSSHLTLPPDNVLLLADCRKGWHLRVSRPFCRVSLAPPWWAAAMGVNSTTDPFRDAEHLPCPKVSIMLLSVLCTRTHIMAFFQKSVPWRCSSTLNNRYSSSFQIMKMI